MQKKFKTVLLFVICAVLVISGCSSNKDDPSKGNASEGDKNVVTAAGEFPITEEPTTIRIMVNARPGVENYKTNAFTKYLEEKTNVKIEWDIVPSTAAAEKLNLTFGGGNLPDVIMGFGVTNAQQMIFGSQGIIIPLNELIEKYGVETKRMFQENLQIEEAVTAPDGNIYALPMPNDCYHCSMIQKMWVYKPWLDKLGMQPPTTIDEFYDMLKAFKTQDPNGNGLADEIPMAGSPKGWETRVDRFLMNAFTYNPSGYVYLNNGKPDVSFNKPEWKEGVEFLNKLYNEGLLDPQSLTQDESQLIQLGENPKAPLLGVIPAGFMGSFSEIGGPSGRFKEYVTLAPLKGPKGLQITPLAPYEANSGHYVITKAAKNPEVAFRLADALYNKEMTLRSLEGELGVHWDWADEGEIGINGEPAIWKRLMPFPNIQNDSWEQTAPTYRPAELRLGQVNDPDNPLESILYNETKNNYEPYKASQDMVMPRLFFTSEQSSELSDLQKTITDYVSESLSRFITGDANIETEWDNYLKNLESMNLSRFLEIYQEAYDVHAKK